MEFWTLMKVLTLIGVVGTLIVQLLILRDIRRR